jgi:hypothetical protein
VRNEPEQGIVPRGLIFENRNGAGHGLIVVGLNPGIAKPEENLYRLEHGNSFQTVKQCWDELGIKDLPYFTKPRHLISELGSVGDILWTNIAKCECLSRDDRISFSSEPQTFRFCSTLYLRRELELFPDWPLFACGKDAFTALSYICPTRRIVGFPHPTGAGIEFNRLFLGNRPANPIKPEVKSRYCEFFASEPQGALWLRGSR